MVDWIVRNGKVWRGGEVGEEEGKNVENKKKMGVFDSD